MPDPKPTLGTSAAGPSQSYPIPPAPATPSLREQLAMRIQNSGPISFSEFMSMALYTPEQGYYSQHTQQVGKSGDFFTSVSVGPLFGELLARRFLAEWNRLGKPATWRITECGAHDGTLAKDILDAIATMQPKAYTQLQYAIPEPLDSLRQAQRQTLAEHAQTVLLVSNTNELPPAPGVVFGNELLDALPFDVIEFRSGHWHECRVGLDPNDAFTWQLCPPARQPWVAALEALGTAFPDGYRSEIRTSHASFLATLRSTLTDGIMVWMDYGFAREDYYHPDRTSGTLRTFSKHQAGDDPLSEPGQVDITAHVDFTAIRETLEALGSKTRLQSQGSWLTAIAREWLLAQEGQPDTNALRQFQTLTHPSHLGRSFQIIEATFDTKTIHTR